MKKLLALSLLIAAPSAAFADKFYLSSDRVFAPGQKASVNLEAQGVASLQIRIYRLPDPKKYFDAQADLHRPTVDHLPPRPATWSLLRQGFRDGLAKAKDELRDKLGTSGKRALRRVAPETYAAAIGGGGSVPKETVRPPLPGLELLDVWDEAPGGDGGSWSYSTVEVPSQDVGAYLVEAATASDVASTVVLISDVALVTKQSADELLVWSVDPATGAPRADVDLTVLSGGQTLKTGRSDSHGLARFALASVESLVVYGQHDKSFTLLDPRFYAANLPEPRVYLFTERPVYRPGQDVFFKGFARGMKAERFELLAAQDIEVTLHDPSGAELGKVPVKLSARGGFDGKFSLPEQPAMGMWTLEAMIDGVPHQGQFKVMAFVKPEVRLVVRPDQRAITAGGKISGDVTGSYFFGGPYPKAEVKITLTRTRFYIPWWVDASYAWYYSDAEYRNTAREPVGESSCKLDQNGVCEFSFDTQADPEAADYTYVLEATALDPGGKTVSGSTQVTVTTGEFRLSFLPGESIVRPGQKPVLIAQAVDYAGAPVKTSLEILVEAKHVAADGVVETVEVLRRSVETDAKGQAKVEVDAKRGGYYQVSAKAKDARGHSLSAETFVFASEGKGDLPFAPAGMEIVTDKKSYFSGEKALVLVLAPASEADILFTVEGGALYRVETVKAKRYAALVEVEIGERQTPNFFLTATAVTGGEIHTKQRSVIVPPREKILAVEVAPDRADAEPGESVGFTVHVTDFAGKPVANAEVALGVVDEAIYAISPEIAVPLESFYYPRKRNDVRSQDSLTFRFFGTSKAYLAKKARFGRDPEIEFGALKPQLDDTRKVFKDTADWFPSLTTDKDGKAQATVKLPDNLTAWRATARVLSPETQVGVGTGSVRARKLLMMRMAMPARLVEGDRGQGALLIQNVSAEDLPVKLALAASGPAMTTDPTPPGLSIRGADGSALPSDAVVKKGDTLKIPFTYTASGSGALTLVARAEGAKLKDAMEVRLPIDEWASVVRVSESGRTSGDRTSLSHELTIPAGAKPEETRVEIELASSTLSAVQASLPYLADYPYGCTEQTMSRFIPLLAAKATVEGLSLDAGDLALKLPAMLGAGMARLHQLQHQDGGFGWWENDATDPFMTAWVVEGLGEASKLGMEVDQGLTDRAIDALTHLLEGGDLPADLRAYALYAAALHDKHFPAMLEAAMEDIKEERLSPWGDAYLLLASTAAKKTEVAGAAKAALLSEKAYGRASDGAITYSAGGGNDRIAATSVEATAVALRALIGAGEKGPVVDGAVLGLMSEFEEQRFGTTRETGLAVRALLADLTRAPVGEGAVTVTVDGKQVAEERFDAKRMAQPALRILPAVRLSGRSTKIEVRQTGASSFFHTVSLAAPVRDKTIPASSRGGLKIKRSFFALSGSHGAYQLGKPSARFTAGDTLLVRLDVEAEKPQGYVIIEDPRPAGLSAVGSDSGMQIRGIDLRPKGMRRELRDDKSAFFFSALPAGKTSVYYLARAGLTGSFRALPSKIETMYAPATHHGESGSTGVEISARP
ncbi:MAG: MG2 domain-containing protein [Myxococcota bacterium]